MVASNRSLRLPGVPVLVVAVLLGAAGAQEHEVTGRVIPDRELAMRAAVDSRVVEVLVSMGDVVEAGQPLLRADRRDLEFAVRRAEVQAEAAELRARLAEVGLELAAKQIETAEFNLQNHEPHLDAVQQDVELAERAAASMVSLYEAGRQDAAAVTAARLQVATARAQAARVEGQLLAARGGVDTARLQRLRAEIVLDEARVGLEGARIELECARSSLERAEWRAPFGGRVTRVMVVAGDTLSAGGRIVLELVDARRVRVRCALPGATARSVRVGAPALVSNRDGRAEGEVCGVRGTIDADSGTMDVDVLLDNTDGSWIPGEWVQVVLSLD